MVATRKRSPLHVPELFYHILNFLAEPDDDDDDDDGALFTVQPPQKEGRRALAALAQTCRTFSEPSLDCLWRKLLSLKPLVRCFIEADVVDIARDVCVRPSFPEFSLVQHQRQDPPSQAQWNVIIRYAYRIQELAVGDNDSPSVYMLECSAFEPNLLPNLTVLSWQVSCDPVTLIHPLLSTKLGSLHLYMSPETVVDRTMTSLLKTLPSRCPGLKAIDFDVSNQNAHLITSFLSRAICRFENLARIAIDAPVDGDALRHLVMSPQFVGLVIENQQSQLAELCVPLSDTPFPSAKEITLSGIDLAHIAGLLRSEYQSFSTVEIHLGAKPTSQLTHHFLTIIASRPRQLSLTSIMLDTMRSVVRSGQRGDTSYDLSHNTLQPLTLLRNLRELRIDLTNSIFLDDNELAGLACGWPSLQVLELGSMDGSSTKHLTFKGLLLLSAACPELQRIALSLDGQEIPVNGVGVDVCGNAVEGLTFPRSPIKDSYFVAGFLLTHFPSVTSVGYWDNEDAHHKRWARVQMYLDRKNEISLSLRVKSSS